MSVNKKVVLLHAELLPTASKDDLDVLAEMEAVSSALNELGYEPVTLPLSLDFNKAVSDLKDLNPAFVFNLVESIYGFGQFIYFAPTLLDYLKLPYTGSRTNAFYITTNKVLTKERLQYARISTPDWLTTREINTNGRLFEPPYIIKPIWEDASVGLDEKALLYDESLLKPALESRNNVYGECFVEAYIHGREFNLSILAGRHGPEVLPPAEIVFRDYPKGKPRIVGYSAKWDTDSFEYQNTIRQFDFQATDFPLLNKMSDIARRCWTLFELQGYARIDFRVDRKGNPLVLEVNVNPCISADAGFVAAAEKAGLGFTTVIERIIHDSVSKEKRK